MAKEKVKQWVILIVASTWLLTTLSACGMGGSTMPFSKIDLLSLDLSHDRASVPTYIRDSHELIYVDGQSCPDKLWGRWIQVTYPNNSTRTFSQTTDKSGVHEITQKIHLGFGVDEETYIVDGKFHNDGKLHYGKKFTYAASCHFKLKDLNYKVFRLVKNFPSGEALVEDYIVGGKLQGVSILGHRLHFTRNRHLDLENSMSVATRYEGLYGKE